jgi:D-threo-aldose 1-dehydrogenase
MGGAMIPHVPVGNTGISITRIGLGGASIGDLRRTPTEAEAHALLEGAWDAGIRYFDTAPFYGSGLSERRIGDFLRGRPRDSHVLSTKVGRLLVPDRAWAVAHYESDATPPFRPVFDFSYGGIMRSYEHSLHRLALDRVDMLLLHDIGRFSQADGHERAMEQALAGGGLRALEELRSSGAVRAIGVGVNEWQVLDDLMKRARFDVFLLANRYTLLDQAVLDHFLPRVQGEGISVIIGAALNSGILLTGAVSGAQYDYAPAPAAILEKTRAIEAICVRHGVPLVRAALNFPLAHPAVTALLLGASVADELAENLGHLRADVPAALWTELREAGLIHPEAPLPVSPSLPKPA